MTREEYDEVHTAAVERSFRDDAIRTAMLIDDQFPDYLQMHGAVEGQFRDVERAKRLYNFLHKRGLLCDIQNWRAPQDVSFELVDKIRKSDLVVLDYRLGEAGPAAALSILRHLAKSPHFNLVVVYTADPLVSVALAAAIAMRGVADATAELVPSAGVLEQAADLLERDEYHNVDVPALSSYLRSGRAPGPWQAGLQADVKEAKIDLSAMKPLAEHIARSWIATLVGDYQPEKDVLRLHGQLEDEQALWIQAGSCFAAVVGKQAATAAQDEGAFVWGKLGQALRAWRPNVYRLLLSEIQNALELEAITDHEAWLDDNLCLGLGLYLFESEAAAKGGDMVPGHLSGASQNLIDRFVDLIRRRLASHHRIAATATGLLEGALGTPLDQTPNESIRRARARQLAQVPADRPTKWVDDVLPAVNAFMISDDFRSGHLTTGSVLKDERSVYWVCASPACDLEPRDKGPLLIQVMRLEPTGKADKFTPGDKVAFAENDTVKILRILGKDNRQPVLTELLLRNGTHVSTDAADDSAPPSVTGFFVTDAKFGATTVAGGEQGDVAEAPVSEVASSIVLPETKFTVVAQLRNSFATRFLMITGHHLSRVGVNFIDV